MEQYQVATSQVDGQQQVILQTMPQMVSGTQSPQAQVRNEAKLGKSEIVHVTSKCQKKIVHFYFMNKNKDGEAQVD